jgi:protein gp37
MAYETKIEWTATYLNYEVMWQKEMTKVIPGATFNPWWGCMKVSPACKHCYAEYLSDTRMGGNHWGPGSERRKFGDKHWNEPLKWNKECEKLGIRRKVFCASMADVFEDHPDVIEERERLWRMIDATPYLDWLLLTKRPENILMMLPDRWYRVEPYMTQEEAKSRREINRKVPTNVWFGTTAEDQEWSDKRIGHLTNVKIQTGRKIFLSMEPLLGPVDLEQDVFPHRLVRAVPRESRTKWLHLLDWVIAGGESGINARPSHPNWFISLRDQCEKYSVPFFFKQWGEYGTKFCTMGEEPKAVFKMYHDYDHFAAKDWVEKGDQCIDVTGKICKIGMDFRDAEYPVAIMNHVGKKRAGRELDGKLYNDMP